MSVSKRCGAKLALWGVAVAILVSCGGDSPTGPDSTPGSTSSPLSPSNLVTDRQSPTLIELTWQDNADNEAGFEITRVTGSLPSPLAAMAPARDTVPANTESYRDTSVLPGAEYTYSVRAFNDVGSSSPSNFSVAPAAAPDLRIYAPGFTDMGEIEAGQTATVFPWAVVNDGLDSSASECLLTVRLSRDTIINAADPVLRVDTVPQLRIGQQWNITIHRVEIPVSTEGGRYLVSVKVDAGATIDEMDETNNHVLGQIDITPVDPPAVPDPPSGLIARDFAYYPLTGWEFYASWQDNSDNEQQFQICISRNLQFTENSCRFVPSDSTIIRYSDRNLSGRYYLRVRASNDAGYSEYSTVYQLDIPDPKPDLTIEQDTFIVVPNRVRPGDEITVADFNVRNVGNDNASNVTVWWWLGSSSRPNLSQGVLLRASTFASLAGNNGGRLFVAQDFTIPPLAAGTYYVSVVVDPQDVIDEFVETNNHKSFRITVE